MLFDYLDNGKSLYDTDPALFQSAPPRFSKPVADLRVAEREHWSKRHPFQLAVVRAVSSGRYLLHNQLSFTLPVNPESMMVSMPMAIGVSATLGGVVEQHGGAPFRQIVFSGSFGVVNDRPSGSGLQGGVLDTVKGIFAGTAQGLSNIVSSAASLGVGEKYKENLSSETPTPGDIEPGSTGYYQFRALQQFLEGYVEAKKRAEGRDLRLALFVWKDDAAYIVTPMAFDVTQSAASPFEKRYSLRFQAWRRVDPRSIAYEPTDFTDVVKAKSRWSLARAHSIISNATRTANAVTNTLRAFRADSAKIADTLRQAALFCTALGGIARTAVDLPAAIRSDWADAIEESWDILKASFDGLDPATKDRIAAIDAEVKSNRSNPDKSGRTRVSPALVQALRDDNASDFHALIKPDALNLSPEARAALTEHIEETTTLSSDDFRRAADQVLALVADFADAVGLNNATYDRVTGRTAKPALRAATTDDFRAMHSLAEAADALQSLVINTPTRQAMTAVEYVAGVANENGIAMRVPRSKFAVPFPYGSSLERLAAQYLGDPARWMEIAELNNLRAPYIDETGTTSPLVAPGNGSTIVVSNASGLTLGQLVRIWSDTTLVERRRVVDVQQVDATTWRVVLDGDADLAKYLAADNATIQWYLAGTVNSQQIIYIPSDSPPNPDILKYVPNFDDVNRVLTVGEVDGMLTQDGDLVVTPDGDWPFVTGYAYLIQWAWVALNTPLGALSLHPGFGVNAEVGASIADASASDILKSLNDTLTYNPSFTGVLSALVQRNGPTTQVTMEAGVRNIDALLPLTFDVKS